MAANLTVRTKVVMFLSMDLPTQELTRDNIQARALAEQSSVSIELRLLGLTPVVP
jgi:hypothetical protein